MLSAQAMDAATRVCNEALGGSTGKTKGKVIMGTVQGDVHDIGKAIVIAYLKAHGYEVTDAGRDVPAATFIAKAKEISADVIGMSALLTTTMEEQRKVIKMIRRREEDRRRGGPLSWSLMSLDGRRHEHRNRYCPAGSAPAS